MDQQRSSSRAKDTRRSDVLLRIRLEDNALRKKSTPFLCNFRFKNDLPELSCDPKMLLPPFNPAQFAAFNLTSLEKEMKRDVLFPPDLGIPINALDIERYSVQTHGAPAIDPADAALLQDEGEARGARPARGMPSAHTQRSRALREGASDVSWLMRTKYITNNYSNAAARRAAGKAPRSESAEDLLPSEDPETQIAEIEASFEAAHKPPVHPKNPNATPLDILPILPDDLLEGWSCVQATFDGDPGADVDALAKLPAEKRARSMQASQLKSFVRRRPDGSKDSFVTWLLPAVTPEPAPADANADGALVMTASQLRGDYEWVREYDSRVQYDERGQTYLLRIGKDYVGYSDLNTKVALKKRKRGMATGEEEEGFLQPEKFILELLDDDEEDDQGGVGASAPAAAPAVQPRAQPAALMKNVFGSDDEDDD